MLRLIKGGTEIGAFHVPGNKLPVLGISVGGHLSVFGRFQNKDSADDFMMALAEFITIGKEADRHETDRR